MSDQMCVGSALEKSPKDGDPAVGARLSEYTGDDPYPYSRRTVPHPPVRTLAVRSPNSEVVAAVEFLLGEPDAHRYRKRYLELLSCVFGADGIRATDYAAAEKYVVAEARRLRTGAGGAAQQARERRDRPDASEEGAGSGERVRVQ